MDTATITFFESDSSADDFENTSPSDSPYQIIKPEEVTFAQCDDESNSSNRDNVNNFSEIYNPCSISQVQDTVVSNLAKNREDEPLGSTNCEQIVNNWVYDEENKFESSNSLDIEKELNDLIGTLSSDIGGNQSNYPNEVQENEKLCLNRNENALEERGDEGSRINLAYDVTEPENEYHSPDGSTRNRQCQTPISNLDPYWTDQRIKSKSFAERYKLGKLLRRGKQRMSMIEFRNGQRRPRETEFNDSELNHSAAIDRYDSALVSYAKECSEVGVAYDRSSLIEPRVSSTISLAPRPHSTIDGSHLPYYSSESPTGGSNPCNDATGSCESAISINEAEDSPPSRKTR